MCKRELHVTNICKRELCPTSQLGPVPTGEIPVKETYLCVKETHVHVREAYVYVKETHM